MIITKWLLQRDWGKSMKSPYKVYASGRIVLILGLLVMFLVAQSVEAREIAGVTVPETVSIADRTLVLNGAGIRKKFFVKVYVGALCST